MSPPRKPLVTVQLVGSAGAGKVHRAAPEYEFPWPECRSYPVDAASSTRRIPKYRNVTLDVTCTRCQVLQLTEQAIAEARQRGDTAVIVPA
jgi:hypothetical protein